MPRNSHERPQKAPQIEQDHESFSRIMSKENTATAGDTSTRVYYGGAGSVPFMWESRPGTPKHPSLDTSLPPLTPPPSFYSSNLKSKKSKHNTKPNNLIKNMIPRFTSAPKKTTHVSPLWSLYSSSSSSSSSASSSMYYAPSGLRYGTDDDDDHDVMRHEFRSRTIKFKVKDEMVNGFRGCYSMTNVKDKLMSIVGHGSG